MVDRSQDAAPGASEPVEPGEDLAARDAAPRADADASSVALQDASTIDALVAQLSDGAGAPDAPQTWIALQARLFDGARHAILQMGPADKGPFMPAASWPSGKAPPAALRSIAAEVLSKRTGVVHEAGPDGAGEGVSGVLVAEPILIGGALHGVVAFEIAARAATRAEALRRQLRVGFGWLDAYVERREREAEGGTKERIESVLGLLATTLEYDRFQGAVTAFVTELASELDCDRVSAGFLKHGELRVAGISHSARFGRRTNLVRCIEAAMQESLDEQTSIVYPPPEGALPRAAQAHKELARQFGARAICSVPLIRAGEACGVVTLERDEPFGGRTLGLVEVTSALVGPPLDALRLESRFIGTKVLDSVRDFAHRLIGPHHVAIKLVTGVLTAMLFFLTCAKGDFRVTADAILVPDMRRAAVAPFDGFIAEAPVRAGDMVEEGELLASLDDRDLELERVKWESENAQASKQYRQALAERDPAPAEILSAAVEESRAELDRILGHLARSDLRAPFDGVVVAGDLTQRLGAPVRRGDVLFEVAPLDSYRVEMKVSERDIAHVSLTQSGSLVLAAFPEEDFRFEVNKVTPVTLAEEGQNTFLVEARIDDDSGRLRPGIEGVAKIEVDERRLIWIWTRDPLDWLRLQLWRYLP